MPLTYLAVIVTMDAIGLENGTRSSSTRTVVATSNRQTGSAEGTTHEERTPVSR